jgi:hypothetical protein
VHRHHHGKHNRRANGATHQKRVVVLIRVHALPRKGAPCWREAADSNPNIGFIASNIPPHESAVAYRTAHGGFYREQLPQLRGALNKTENENDIER